MTEVQSVHEDDSSEVLEAVLRLEAGADPNDVLAWLHDQGASLWDAMRSLGRAHVDDYKRTVYRHPAWTEESIQHIAFEDPCLALFEGMSIGAAADPDIEDRLRAATPDQQLRIIDVLLTDAMTDAVLTPEKAALADGLRRGVPLSPGTLVALQEQQRELEIANARVAIARMEEGEEGGYDEMIWPSVRTCRCLSALVEASQADSSDRDAFPAAVFAALGDAADADGTIASILAVLQDPATAAIRTHEEG